MSQHVDGEMPGDRDTQCHGKMIPTEYDIRNGETKIHFVCMSCQKDHRNKAADDDELWELDSRIKSWKKQFIESDEK